MLILQKYFETVIKFIKVWMTIEKPTGKIIYGEKSKILKYIWFSLKLLQKFLFPRRMF